MNLILITLGLLALAIICWRIMLRVSPEQLTVGRVPMFNMPP